MVGTSFFALPSPSMSVDTPSSAANREQIEALLDQAFAAFEQGQVEPARRAFLAVLALDQRDFDALHMLGVIAMQADKDMPRAIGLLRQAVEADPEVGMAYTNLGIACMESGQPEPALAAFDKAVVLEPSVEAFFGRGTAQAALEQWASALESFGQVVAAQPRHAQAHFNRGTALLALRRFADALAAYEQAIALQPRHVAALINKGHALQALGRHADALAAYDEAIAIEPTRPAAWLGRGDASLDLQRHADALACFDKALTLKPDHVEALCNRATALLRMGRIEEAVTGYERALAVSPSHAVTLTNLSGALREAQRHEEALAMADRAVAQAPDLAHAHMNRGNALLDLCRLDQASGAYARALALLPDETEPRWALGWTSLLAGDWAQGLPLHEIRWQKPGFSSRPRGFRQPLWLGPADAGELRGKTILLHAEQGLGDTLQFCRYAPMVAALGARVLLEVQPPLKKLMATLAGPAQVLAAGEPLPAFDVHCPLMSLPLAFQSTPAKLPADVPYLRADPALVQKVAQTLSGREAGMQPKGQARIGLVWSGNAAHRHDRHRSMPLATLLAALPPGPAYYCLQKDVREADAATLTARPDVACLNETLQNFDDTAALVEQMDLVITIDTSLAHLAGALGKPTWILLARSPDWRWLMDREDSPWYPSARLFRQAAWGQWDAPLAQVRHALDAWLKA
jgi:tetratricopeptide (TPR) repeat protein